MEQDLDLHEDAELRTTAALKQMMGTPLTEKEHAALAAVQAALAENPETGPSPE